MQCNRNCKHWHKNVPSDYIIESAKNGITVEPGTYGFCEVMDDVRFTIESCEVSDEAKKNAEPLVSKNHCPACGGLWVIHAADACRTENPEKYDEEGYLIKD